MTSDLSSRRSAASTTKSRLDKKKTFLEKIRYLLFTHFQSMMIHMYFAVMWLEPRIVINETAVEWDEDRTGPKDEVNESPETLKYLWYPELEIYGLETFGRQRVLKEMSGVRMGKNKTINYELGVRVTISCRMVFDDYPLDDHSCQFQVGSCERSIC